jgi:hypothetical protein
MSRPDLDALAAGVDRGPLSGAEWRIFWQAMREWNDTAGMFSAHDPHNAILRSALDRILATRTALIHARWHRALDDPASEPPGPIRDHIEQVLRRPTTDGGGAE